MPTLNLSREFRGICEGIKWGVVNVKAFHLKFKNRLQNCKIFIKFFRSVELCKKTYFLGKVSITTQKFLAKVYHNLRCMPDFHPSKPNQWSLYLLFSQSNFKEMEMDLNIKYFYLYLIFDFIVHFKKIAVYYTSYKNWPLM